MKKSINLLLLFIKISTLFLLLFILTSCSANNQNKINEKYEITKLSTNKIENSNEKEKNNNKPKEEDIASFSTNILYKDENRQNNMDLACKELNGTIVKAHETFSFCDTLGKATPDKGYEKAEVFESDGDIVYQYGGGKCQISSTLYNAVLQIPTLTVIERHAHSRRVSYVEEGKDAAVSFGSVDFKFRNDNDYDIKIYAQATPDTINIRLTKINY